MEAQPCWWPTLAAPAQVFLQPSSHCMLFNCSKKAVPHIQEGHCRLLPFAGSSIPVSTRAVLSPGDI